MGQWGWEEYRAAMEGRNPPTGKDKADRRREEQRMQIELVDSLPLILRPGTVFFHVPMGGKRRRVDAAILKAMGSKPGVSDLVFLRPEGSWCLELKSPTGSLEQSQREYRRECKAANIPYAVAESIGQALDHLGRWGLLKDQKETR